MRGNSTCTMQEPGCSCAEVKPELGLTPRRGRAVCAAASAGARRWSPKGKATLVSGVWCNTRFPPHHETYELICKKL